MECRPLDITVLSAKGLKNVNLLSKMDVYVVVSLSGGAASHRQKTPVDKDAGTSPQWNFPMKFTLDESAVQTDRVALVFTIMSDRSLGDTVIGEVRVNLKELLDGSAGESRSEKTMSYVVVTPKGKKKGSLDFAYRFGDKYTYTAPAAPAYGAPPAYAAAPAYGAAPAAYGAAPAAYGAAPAAYGAAPAAYGASSAPIKGSDEPAMAYPATAYPAAAGSSSGYAPPQGYAQPGYGYPPQYAQSHGYPPQYAQQGYGYPPAVKPPKKSGGSKLGLGLAGGLLGGLLIGDMISDAGDMGGCDGGFDGGFDF